jgi:murein DD-endopeptidase MepM/ murein hydrolase activator NlpD
MRSTTERWSSYSPASRGGLTVYQFDPAGQLAYYYAHLERYAEGVHEGMMLRRGDVLGYVGTSGNAAPGAPHLHFAVFRLGPEKQWWNGTAVNPYPELRRSRR